jgi:hypothetical protein
VPRVRKAPRVRPAHGPNGAEISAPTSGTSGLGMGEIGAALSWGSRAAPILLLFQRCEYEYYYLWLTPGVSTCSHCGSGLSSS